jgi:hypothetical protein
MLTSHREFPRAGYTPLRKTAKADKEVLQNPLQVAFRQIKRVPTKVLGTLCFTGDFVSRGGGDRNCIPYSGRADAAAALRTLVRENVTGLASTVQEKKPLQGGVRV